MCYARSQKGAESARIQYNDDKNTEIFSHIHRAATANLRY